MKRKIAAAAFLLLVSCAGAAQSEAPVIPDHVIYLGATGVSIARGKATPVTLQFKILPKYHINSNKPKSELLVPTVLSLDPPTDVVVGKITYPAGIDANFAFAPSETLNVYAGKFAITALVSAAKIATPGKYRVHGFLKYQACDDRACYPPKKLPADFDITVLKSKSSGTGVVRRGQSPHIHK
jgi:cytochrome c biogenesis DsbD-like protein